MYYDACSRNFYLNDGHVFDERELHVFLGDKGLELVRKSSLSRDLRLDEPKVGFIQRLRNKFVEIRDKPSTKPFVISCS